MHSVWKQMFNRPILVVALLSLVLILAACPGDQAEEATPTEEPVAAEEEVAPTEEPEEEPEQEPTATPEPEEEATPTPEPEEEEPTPTAMAEEEPTATAMAEEEMPEELAYGEYIVNLTGGCGCHFDREVGGLAGGLDFSGPFGVVYARNITPHAETGIGDLSPEEVATALRIGQRPDGTQLHPIMPYRSFSGLADSEALAVAEYLLSLEPIENEIPDRELESEPAAFEPDEAPPAEPPTDPVARGEVLVSIARCGSCHTPSGAEEEMFLAGSQFDPEETAPNITPDEETGIGSWSAEEIAHLMQTGERPDGSEVEGSMAQQIDRRFSLLTDEDALAIGEYLQTIPAVSNDPFGQ